LQALIKDLKEDTPVNLIASRFHNGVAEMVRQVCNLMRDHFDTGMVALSGGVWQNMVLLNKTIALLKEDGFQVIIHAQVPANDGGIALGQAAIAIHHLRN
jgi:hydrogenase maturation protein HypF